MEEEEEDEVSKRAHLDKGGAPDDDVLFLDDNLSEVCKRLVLPLPVVTVSVHFNCF